VNKAADLDKKKQALLDKIDVIGADIAMTNESTINNLVDLKTKLHKDKDRMVEALQECSESLQQHQTNISILEVKNQQTQ